MFTPLGEILTHHIQYRILISKVYKAFTKLTKNKPNILIQKWAEEMERHFLKVNIQMARAPENGSSLLAIRDVYIKTTMSYHLTSMKMASIKKSGNNQCWQGGRKKGTSFIVCVDVF